MKRRFVTQRIGAASLLAAVALVAMGQRADAAAKYWDTDGVTAGLQVGDGIWDTGTTSSWSTSSAGTALATWADGDSAVWTTPTAAGPSVVAVSGTIKLVNGTSAALEVTSSNNNVTLTGGTLQFDTASGNKAFYVTSAGAKLTVDSNVVLNAPASAYTTFTSLATTGFLTINGNISQTNTSNKVRLTGGTAQITLGGANTYTGGTQLDAGTNATITNGDALGSGTVALTNTATTSSILNVNLATDDAVANAFQFNLGGTLTAARTATINSLGAGAANLSNTGQITFGAFFGGNSNIGALDLRFGGASTAANTFAGLIKNGPVVAASDITSVTKQDAGTWILSNANTYTGATTVNGGTLVVNGDQSAATGAVTVNSTGTLGGTGTIGGATAVNNGGKLSPGISPGTLTFNTDLTVAGGVDAAGGTANFEAGDLVDVNGTLTLNDGWNLSLQTGFQDGGSVTLFTYTTAGGTLDLTPDIDIAGLGFTPSGELTLTDTGSAIVLNGVSVPEPASAGLLLGMTAMGLLASRRRARAGR